MILQVSDPYAGYSADTTDDEARRQAARRLRVPQERIELQRTGGAVLARVQVTADEPVQERLL